MVPRKLCSLDWTLQIKLQLQLNDLPFPRVSDFVSPALNIEIQHIPPPPYQLHP
jgi:hypothetical protein